LAELVELADYPAVRGNVELSVTWQLVIYG
jgi:hypothetical protein